MRDDHGRPFPKNGSQSLEDSILRLRIHARKAVIQDQDRGLHEQRARQSRPLFLAAGKSDAALSNDRIQPLGKDLQIPIQAREPDRLFHFLI